MFLGALLLLAATPKDVASRVRTATTPHVDVGALRAIGPQAIPHMVALYRTADVPRRAELARAFYELGWESPEAKRALLADLGTDDGALRLQVQWALGRVSGDDDVVERLAAIMQNDANPLFRDKAACALAFDQIHLSEEQKVRMYAKVVGALRDPKLQVRQIAAQVLQIHLGQSKGFRAGGTEEEREKAVRAWERWLEEYASNL